MRQIVEAEVDTATSAIGAETDAVLAPSTSPHLQRAERLAIAKDLARREVADYDAAAFADARPGDRVAIRDDGTAVVYRPVRR